MPKNILILGTPRSGTSLTTRILVNGGYYLGGTDDETVRVGDRNNPFGYFEADDIVDANVELYAQAGYSFHNSWLYDAVPPDFTRRIEQLPVWEEHRSLLANYDRTRTPWVWKDVRFCYTLGYWWRILDPATTGVIVVRRDPEEIYESLLRTGWLKDDTLGRKDRTRLIADHLRAAETTIRRLRVPHVVIDYRSYHDQPPEVARALGDFCGTPLEVEALIVKDLDRSTLRGRLSTKLRISLDQGWLRHLRFLRPLVPDRVKRFLLQEIDPRKSHRSLSAPAVRFPAREEAAADERDGRST